MPRLVGTLLGVSPEFIASQTAAENVYRFHMVSTVLQVQHLKYRMRNAHTLSHMLASTCIAMLPNPSLGVSAECASLSRAGERALWSVCPARPDPLCAPPAHIDDCTRARCVQLHNGLFPRPCPHCGDRQFLVPALELERQRREAAEADRAARSARRGMATVGSNSNSNSNARGVAAQSSAASAVAGIPSVAADSLGSAGSFPAGPSLADGSGVGPVAFQSRPLVCEQCQRWAHFGCVGIRCVEDVPSRPWFHCK